MGHLINGEGQEVVAQRDANIYAALGGSMCYIAGLGGKMAATITSNTNVRLADGMAFAEGRAVEIPANSYDDFAIPEGQAGVNATYYLGYHITTEASTGLEKAEQIVSKVKSESNGLRAGGNDLYMWLYQANLTGVVLASVTRLVPQLNSPIITMGTVDPVNNDGMPDGSVYIKITG